MRYEALPRNRKLDVSVVIQGEKMTELTIRIDDKKKEFLETIASFNNKELSDFIEGMIENYIESFINRSDESEKKDIKEIMKLSESSFAEWNNEEDNIYDSL